MVSRNGRLAAIALTGYMCDVTFGVVITLVSRHIALLSFFNINISTTLAFHMTTAYALFALVLVHWPLDTSWIPVFERLLSRLRKAFLSLNPTYKYLEIWPGNVSSLGVRRASLIFTGILDAPSCLLIGITILPFIRRRQFNLFYFTHFLDIAGTVVIYLLYACTQALRSTAQRSAS